MMLRALMVALVLCPFVFPAVCAAAVKEYHLLIAQEEIAIEGTRTPGMTINGSIPGPVLRFNYGDLARIHVTNTMEVPTSIHWHGILVPPDMDGVPFVTQVPIQPGTTFTYEFPLRQTGTYWYHSHSELQEQSGLYGAMVIHDEEPRPPADHDHVVLFSDWTVDKPREVLRTLKRGSEWFALEKGSAQSLVGATVAGRLGDYLYRELQRMPPMDIADVAYDYFLANGQREITLDANPGETVRLRLIDGSATTYFHLDYAGGPMTIVSADGQAVEPTRQDRFLMGVAETYDVLITAPQHGAAELRATAHDGSGYASVWVGSGKRHPAPDIPKPDLYQNSHRGTLSALLALTPAGSMGMPDSEVEAGRFDQPGMMGMAHHDMMDLQNRDGNGTKPASDHGHHEMSHGSSSNLQGGSPEEHSAPISEPMDQHALHGDSSSAMQPMGVSKHKSSDSDRAISARPYGKRFGLLAADIASRKDRAVEGSEQRPGTPYGNLRSLEPTTLPEKAPVREIRLTLDGDMERYVWFLNNKPLAETDHILIREGEVVRFILINRTMMHHPMHLHGHFFRVLNGQGDHAPLKHTVDVAPMSTTVIEFYGNEVGDWLFHCHLLYHMKSGMMRLVHYEDFQPASEVREIRNHFYHDPWYAWLDADVLSHMTEGTVSLSKARYMLDAAWEAGWQEVEKTHWEGLLTLGRYQNRFTSFFGGIDILGEGSTVDEVRGVLGIRYLLPLNLDFSAWLDTEAGARLMLEKELELTPRLGLHGEVQYDTHEKWEGAVSLHYLVAKDLSLMAKWHSEFGCGGGVSLRF